MRPDRTPVFVIVSAIGAFDAANAQPGTIVFDNATGLAYVVRITAGVRSLIQLGAGAPSPLLTRTLGLQAVDGAPASGEVLYTLTVLDGAGAPVPNAMVFVGVERTNGVGTITIGAIAGGDPVSFVDQGGVPGALALTGVCDAGGQFIFTVTGTAGDEVQTVAAIDAPAGGSRLVDAGRVLP